MFCLPGRLTLLNVFTIRGARSVPWCQNAGLRVYVLPTWLPVVPNCPFCAKLSTDRMRVRNENGPTKVRYSLDNPPMERNEIDCKITAKK